MKYAILPRPPIENHITKETITDLNSVSLILDYHSFLWLQSTLGIKSKATDGQMFIAHSDLDKMQYGWYERYINWLKAEGYTLPTWTWCYLQLGTEQDAHTFAYKYLNAPTYYKFDKEDKKWSAFPLSYSA